ncbi:hypothetical protein E1301_Tti009155 [Triplophysa tibetana]|uniref:Uncharacterized protein n=1 Tax=Triplophysa tibetana TaxID=1572043 RepID=A0A5A9PMW1_9TELE|nr:hypothetical protein E1301_Tti009155 [Triplophysa tibetana]
MWTFLLTLLLAGAVSAAPLSPFFNYLHHYGNPGQGTNGVFPGMPSQPGINAPISMEIIFPQRFPNKAAGGAGGSQTFPTQAFIKYSLPKAPGRKSVEIVPPFQDGAPQPHDPQQQPQQEQQAQTGQRTSMKIFVFLMCVFGSSLAAPALDSGSNEQAAVNNANTALHLMELYRMIGKLQQQEFNPALLAPRGDGSDEENTLFNGFNPAHGFQHAQPAAPLNSDEAEAAEEAEAVEGVEGAEAVAVEGAEGAEAVAEPTEAAPAVEAGTANEILPVAVDVTVAAADILPEVTAAPVAVEPSAVPQEPLVAVETDTTAVGPDVAIAVEQVVAAEAPDTVLPVQ